MRSGGRPVVTSIYQKLDSLDYGRIYGVTNRPLLAIWMEVIHMALLSLANLTSSLLTHSLLFDALLAPSPNRPNLSNIQRACAVTAEQLSLLLI